MGFGDYLRTQFLEIIQWQDDSRDTISFRYPDMNKEIKRGAQLIVRESQIAQFIYQGQFGDTYGPGSWTLTTDNTPILSTLKGWKYGFESPFKADIYFVNTRLFTGNRWGTANPIMMRDADFGSVRIRAYGTYDFHVVNQKLFLEKVAGTVGQFLLDDFAETMLSRIVSVFSDTLAAEKLAVLDIASQYQVLGDKLLPKLNEAATSRYGIELRSFVIENISLPEDVAQAIDKRSSMAAVGNLNDYMKFEMAEGLSKGKGSGIAATAAQLGAGLVMGQQMGQAIGAAGVPSLLSPSEAAKILGVSESDVLTALGDGSLKGKKIGTSWRITQQSLDEFLKD